MRETAVRETAVGAAAVRRTAVRDAVVRIERGQAGPEELAAITAVLMARAAARTNTPAARHNLPKAGWRPPGHRAPHSWQG
uniref:Acyl-CoA carboxylase subunit epsilon n=1 Tax=Streptomyces sp. NBC_00003 TaxID=2903608 RepID=A0AAU2VFP8_9ACTN